MKKIIYFRMARPASHHYEKVSEQHERVYSKFPTIYSQSQDNYNFNYTPSPAVIDYHSRKNESINVNLKEKKFSLMSQQSKTAEGHNASEFDFNAAMDKVFG